VKDLNARGGSGNSHFSDALSVWLFQNAEGQRALLKELNAGLASEEALVGSLQRLMAKGLDLKKAGRGGKPLVVTFAAGPLKTFLLSHLGEEGQRASDAARCRNHLTFLRGAIGMYNMDNVQPIDRYDETIGKLLVERDYLKPGNPGEEPCPLLFQDGKIVCPRHQNEIPFPRD
jgi:hypothetical protein